MRGIILCYRKLIARQNRALTLIVGHDEDDVGAGVEALGEEGEEEGGKEVEGAHGWKAQKSKSKSRIG